MFLKELAAPRMTNDFVRMKMFVHNSLDEVEHEVNEWMMTHQDITVCQAVQSQSEKQGRFVFVLSLFYLHAAS
jgi:hypothetical protein